MEFSWNDLNYIHSVWPSRKSQHATLIIPPAQKNGKHQEIPMLPGLADLLGNVPKKSQKGWVVDPQPIEFTMRGQQSWFKPCKAGLARLVPTYSNLALGRACGVSERTIRKWLQSCSIERISRASCPGKAIEAETISAMQRQAVRNGRHIKREGRLTVERVGRLICEIGKKAGVVVKRPRKGELGQIKYASSHDLRRGCAQRLINAGVSAETLKVVFRHSTFSTTEKFYGAIRQAQSAAAELHEKLDPGCTNSELVGGLVGGQNEAPQLNAEELKKLKSLLKAL